MTRAIFDLAALQEDDRIEKIGNTIMQSPQSTLDKPIVVGVIVEDDVKADRYISKLKNKFPRICIIDRCPGPVPNTVLLRFGQALN